jgi:hypothetical protein
MTIWNADASDDCAHGDCVCAGVRSHHMCASDLQRNAWLLFIKWCALMHMHVRPHAGIPGIRCTCECPLPRMLLPEHVPTSCVDERMLSTTLANQSLAIRVRLRKKGRSAASRAMSCLSATTPCTCSIDVRIHTRHTQHYIGTAATLPAMTPNVSKY